MPDCRTLAKIHIARDELGLDEAGYRELLTRRYGKPSAARLTPSEADDLLAQFRLRGWRPRKPRTAATRRQIHFIYALWHRLEDRSCVRRSERDALHTFIRHRTGKDTPSRLDRREASGLIEALKQWLQRCERTGS